MADANDTAGARVTSGYIKEPRYFSEAYKYGRKEVKGPHLGSPNRSKRKLGDLHYGQLSREQETYNRVVHRSGLKKDRGKAVNIAKLYGLPKHILGQPLGCGCDEAHLVGATKPVGSHIEADYMCDAGWHNYVVFELIGFEQKTESQIKVDIHGNLIEDSQQATKELAEF